jgi:hypothetical protein
VLKNDQQQQNVISMQLTVEFKKEKELIRGEYLAYAFGKATISASVAKLLFDWATKNA